MVSTASLNPYSTGYDALERLKTRVIENDIAFTASKQQLREAKHVFEVRVRRSGGVECRPTTAQPFLFFKHLINQFCFFSFVSGVRSREKSLAVERRCAGGVARPCATIFF